MTDEVIDKQIVEIVGDTSGLTAAYEDAAAQAQGFETRLSSIGSSLTGFGSKWSLAVTAPLMLAGGAAVSVATSFDDSMRKVQAVTGATGDQFETLRQLALDLGADTAFSASEAASAMQYLGMAGLSTNEIIAATPQMLSLASAGAMELGTAADIATNVLSGFNLQVSDLAHVSDVLARAAASSNTSVEQLGTAMAYVGPVASAAGLSIEETTAAIEVMSNAGIQGSMAGTALRGAISALLTPTKEASDALAAYGIAMSDVDPQTHSLTEIVQTLGDAGLSTADAMTIFGDRAGPGMIALLSSGSDALTDYSDALEDCDGAAQRMAETMEGGAGGRIREFEGAIETLSITFGDLIADALMPAMDAVQGLAEWLSGLDEGTQKAIVTTGLFVAAIGPATLALGTMAGGVSNLITLYRTYQASTIASTIATRGLTAAIASNPIGLAIIGVTTLGAVLLPLITSTRDATEATDEYNEALSKTPDLTGKTTEEIDKEIDALREKIRLNREAAAVLRSEVGPEIRAQNDTIREGTRVTNLDRLATGELTQAFRDSTKGAQTRGSTLSQMKDAEKLATAETLENSAALAENTLAAYENERAIRDLADGAETAYKQASKAVTDHQKKVSALQDEYDTLKQTIDAALGIDEEIEDKGRDVERADIRQIRARQDLNDLDAEIAAKERELLTTEWTSIDEREAAEKELADLKLRHREAVLDLADAEDAYSDALADQVAAQQKRTEIEKELNGESIESAQTRLEEIGKAIDDETAKLTGALKAREEAQTAHEILMNDLNNDALETKSENWKKYVEYIAAHPAIASTVQVEYDADGHMTSTMPDLSVPDIEVPKYADLASQSESALAKAIAAGTYNYNHNATGGPAAAEPAASSQPAGVSIDTLIVQSPASDAVTMAYETKRALRDIGSRGASI